MLQYQKYKYWIYTLPSWSYYFASRAVNIPTGILISLVIWVWGYINNRGTHITVTAARHEKVSPKTWRILGFADATWYLRLQVFTTDQPRCYSFDKVLYPPGFCKKIYGFLVFGTKSSRKIFSFSLVDVGTCKNNEKMFLLTGKTKFFIVLPDWVHISTPEKCRNT